MPNLLFPPLNFENSKFGQLAKKGPPMIICQVVSDFTFQLDLRGGGGSALIFVRTQF